MKREQVEFLLRRRPTGAIIASVLFAIAAGVYGVMMMSQANEVASNIKKEQAVLASAKADLAAANAKILELQNALAASKNETTKVEKTSQANIADFESKIAAFAKQAAACEVIRQRLGKRG